MRGAAAGSEAGADDAAALTAQGSGRGEVAPARKGMPTGCGCVARLGLVRTAYPTGDLRPHVALTGGRVVYLDCDALPLRGTGSKLARGTQRSSRTGGKLVCGTKR